MPTRQKWPDPTAPVEIRRILKGLDVPVSDVSPRAIIAALTKAQKRVGWRWGDIVDEHTSITDLLKVAERLSKRYCAVQDSGSIIRPQAFGQPYPRWSKRALTWSVDPRGCNLSAAEVNAVFTRAFASWQTAAASRLTFSQAPAGTGDIRARFGTATLDDQLVGGVLGLAQRPESGKLYLRSDYTWASPDALLSLTLHEIGHCLGLSHSNIAGRLMYPFDAGLTAVDAESSDAIRLLYGWTPSQRLGDRATSDRPAMAAVSSTGFTTAGSVLHAAWKGTREDHLIWTATLDAQSWKAQSFIGNRGTGTGPAMASYALRTPSGDPTQGLFMAWRGIGDDQGLWYAQHDGFTGWSDQRAIENTGTSTGPALAQFRSKMHLAWKGVEGDHSIYVSTFDGRAWSPQRAVRGIGTSDRPVLAVYNSRLYMFWKGIGEDRNIYYSWLGDRADAIWQAQERVRYVNAETEGLEWRYIASTHSPSVTVRDNRLVLAWKGTEGDNALWISLYDGHDFTGQMFVPGEATSVAPCVYHYNGNTHLLWKGVGDDSTLYWTRF